MSWILKKISAANMYTIKKCIQSTSHTQEKLSQKNIRKNDLLIIEDLQYITTNKASQIELMHTITNITENGVFSASIILAGYGFNISNIRKMKKPAT